MIASSSDITEVKQHSIGLTFWVGNHCFAIYITLRLDLNGLISNEFARFALQHHKLVEGSKRTALTLNAMAVIVELLVEPPKLSNAALGSFLDG